MARFLDIAPWAPRGCRPRTASRLARGPCGCWHGRGCPGTWRRVVRLGPGSPDISPPHSRGTPSLRPGARAPARARLARLWAGAGLPAPGARAGRQGQRRRRGPPLPPGRGGGPGALPGRRRCGLLRPAPPGRGCGLHHGEGTVGPVLRRGEPARMPACAVPGYSLSAILALLVFGCHRLIAVLELLALLRLRRRRVRFSVAGDAEVARGRLVSCLDLGYSRA